MPRVPSYDNMQVAESGQPNVQFQAPSGPTAGSIAAEQQGKLGQALMSTGTEVGKIASDAADMANQVRVNDAKNRLAIAAQDLAFNKDTGYLTKRGASAFLDDQGKPLEKPLTDTYGEKLKQASDEIMSSLGNDRQRALFGVHAGDMSAQLHGNVESHMLGQFGTYQDSVDDSQFKLAKSNSELSYNNPDVLFGKLVDEKQSDGSVIQVRKGGTIDEAKAAVYRKAKRAGLVGDPYEAAVKEGVSSIHEGVVMSALQNGNAEYALNYLKQAREKNEMTGNDILKLQGHVNLAVDNSLATNAVKDQTTMAVPQLAPTGFDRMTQITLSTESGGQRYAADGKTLLTSPKGARGEMQVLDSTNKDPGYGVKPAKDNSPDERARVGRDYLSALVSKYGSPDKAWAAYNAGPGALDKAIKNAAASRGGERTWLSYMPQETQAYVAKNMGMLQGTAPVTQPPTEMEFVSGAVSRLPQGATAQAIKITTEAAKSQFSMITKSLNEKGASALADAQRWVIDSKSTNIADMPPQLRDAITRYAPGKMDELTNFAKSMGNVVTDDSLYFKLVTNPNALTALSDNEFYNLRSRLSKENFDEFAKERANKLQGVGGNAPGNLNTSAINDTLKTRLQSLGIDPTPKDGSTEATQLGTIHRFVREKITEAQLQAGKKFSDAETSAEIDKLFSKNVQFRNSYLGALGSKQSRPLLSTKFDDIPGDLKDAIKKDLQAKGRPTDDGTVLHSYLNLKH